MQRYYLKTSFFLLPLFLLWAFSHMYYTVDKGDLLRLGYVMDRVPDYRSIFPKEDSGKGVSYRYYQPNMPADSIDILTIGDSFSEWGICGYQEYLCRDTALQLCHIPNSVHYNNPISALFVMADTGFFKRYSVKYVLLESVERMFTDRADSCIAHKEIAQKLRPQYCSFFDENFLTDRLVKSPFYSLLFCFDDNAFFSQVYRLPLKSEQFSTGRKELLCFYADLDAARNCTPAKVDRLNGLLNILSEKLAAFGCQLIVLPGPDKYSFYYPFLEQPGGEMKYPVPLFWKHLRACHKKYIFMDTEALLNKAALHTKDLYYYDDSHWSPFGNKVVAGELRKLMRDTGKQP